MVTGIMAGKPCRQYKGHTSKEGNRERRVGCEEQNTKDYEARCQQDLPKTIRYRRALEGLDIRGYGHVSDESVGSFEPRERPGV